KNLRKNPTFELVAGLEPVPFEGRRDLADTRGIARIVAAPARGPGPAPARGRQVARCAVQRERMEGDDIARLHVPGEEFVALALGIEIGQRLEAWIGDRQVDAALPEEFRLEPAAPAMRALHVLHAGRAIDRIERQPQRDDLLAVDRIVGLVVMPGRALARARLLHQEMVVIVDDLARAHEPGGNLARRRAIDKVARRRMALPELEVDEEEAGRALRRVEPDHGARTCHVGIDRLAQALDPVEGEGAAQADRALRAIARDLLVGREARHQMLPKLPPRPLPSAKRAAPERASACSAGWPRSASLTSASATSRPHCS